MYYREEEVILFDWNKPLMAYEPIEKNLRAIEWEINKIISKLIRKEIDK
jgi:hypothetical protein